MKKRLIKYLFLLYKYLYRFVIFLADFDTVFKKGNTYKGIYWPCLTNSFHHKHLELAYLRYSHRQRQKALIIVNLVDLLLKVSKCQLKRNNFVYNNNFLVRCNIKLSSASRNLCFKTPSSRHIRIHTSMVHFSKTFEIFSSGRHIVGRII